MNNPIITASGAIPAYACVKVSTSGSERVEVATSAADVVFGVTLAANTAAGGAVDFQTTDSQLDIFTLKAAGTITIGQYVVPTTNGTVTGATTGPFVALEAAIPGQTFTARKFNAGATANFLAPGTGATTRTLDSKLGDMISVKDFGATGNGSTDDTAALQAVLTANAGKTVYFPPGTYRTTTELLIPANTVVKGDDRKAVIDVQPAHAPITPGQPGPATYTNGFVINGDGVIIDGLKFKGTNEAKYRTDNTIQREEYASGIKSTSRQNLVIKNCMFEQFANGIFFTGGNNYKITDNFFFGGRQMGKLNDTAGSQDIWVKGSTGGSPQKGNRGIISRNHCLGNSDAAINVGGESGDLDVVISENVIEPFQIDGVTAVANLPTTIPLVGDEVSRLDPVLQEPACNKSRYGILVSYKGDWAARMVVSSNVIRNFGKNGIYANSEVTSPPVAGSEVLITGNIVSNTGYSTLAPLSTSLHAGIWINANGGKIVSNNLILDCAVAGIQCISAGEDVTRVLATSIITGNTILRAAFDPVTLNTNGDGIVIAGPTIHSVLVSSNRVFNSAGNAIRMECTSSTTGNCRLDSNMISHTNDKGAIRAFSISSADDCFVSNNTITGQNNVDSNSGNNAGIWISGRVHCTGNSITKFHRGIESQFTARVTDVVCANNTIKNTVFGITGQNTTGPWIVTDNSFLSVSSNVCHAAPYQGTVVRTMGTSTAAKVDIVQVVRDAAPTTGTWVQGDYCKNSTPSVGADKGWYCITAGTPGTWRSEGLLT